LRAGALVALNSGAPLREPTEPEQLFGPHGVELPSFEDDWFRFFYQPGDFNNVRFYEVHEMCRAASCSFRPGTWCPFHPIGCDCSFGACQDDDDALVGHRMRAHPERRGPAGRLLLG
jgi:hypothetical protein